MKSSAVKLVVSGVLLVAGTLVACSQEKGACVVFQGSVGEGCLPDVVTRGACVDTFNGTFYPGESCASLGFGDGSASQNSITGIS